MLAGVVKNVAYLYTSDVTGNFFAYHANSIGENDEKIKEVLRRDYKPDMNIEEGMKFCMKIFRDIMEKNFDLERFEASYVKTSEGKLHRLQGEDLKKYSK